MGHKKIVWVSQKLPLGGFKWVEQTPQCIKNLIKGYNDDRDEGYYLEIDVQYPENLHNFDNDLSFPPENIKTCSKLV